MSRFLLAAAACAALSLSACADGADAPAATTGAAVDSSAAAAPTFTGTAVPIDTAQSRITWTAAKPTRTHEGGFHQFAGSLYVDGGQVTGAEVTAQAASIFSDAERLTGHLQSPDFFDVAQYPEVRFVVTALTPLAAADSAGAEGGAAEGEVAPTHTATGTLTMHGQTHNVEFPVAVEVQNGVATADADFTINRQDWGLTYPGQPDDLIQDEVRINLHIVGRTAAGAAEAAPSM